MKTLWPALLAATVLATPAAAQTAATLMPAQSEITFTSTQMGVPVDGRFRKFDARIALDPKKPEAGSVVLTIEAASATLGVPETDAEFVKPNWFDTAKFAQASFKSTAIKALGSGRFEVVGMLTIKGTSQPLTVPVSVMPSGSNAIAAGSFTIKRLVFKIGEAEWADTSLVANEVQVRFKLALAGLPPL